ncbi:MAG: ATP-binding protein, partial [Bacteroidetes bacterium]
MLITFKICNFLSFNEDVEFSMRASNVRELGSHFIKGKSRSEVNILKSAVIYGANASGKSNFIKAVGFAKDLILKGTSTIGGENKYFRLDNNNKNKSTKFEFEFKYNGKMYAYGIELSLKEQKIKEEWLFQLLKTTDKPIFERKVLANGKSDINIALKFDTETQNRFEVYKKDIKDTQLFLSEINDKNFDDIDNIKPFKNAFDWFQNNLMVIFPDSKPEFLSAIIDNEEVKPSFCNLLEIFGTDIKNIQTIEKDLDKQFPTQLKDDFLKHLKDNNVFEIELGNGKNTLRFFKNKNEELKM